MDGWALATTGVQGRPRAVHDVALPQGVTTAEFFPLCPKQHAGQSFMPMGTALRIGQVESFMAILQIIGGLPASDEAAPDRPAPQEVGHCSAD